MAVHTQDVRDQFGREISQDAADGLLFIVRGNDHRHSHLIFPQLTTIGRTASAVPATHRFPRLCLRVPLPAQAMQEPEPAIPRSTTYPVLISKDCPGTETLPARPAASADQRPAGSRAISRRSPAEEPPSPRGSPSNPLLPSTRPASDSPLCNS